VLIVLNTTFYKNSRARNSSFRSILHSYSATQMPKSCRSTTDGYIQPDKTAPFEMVRRFLNDRNRLLGGLMEQNPSLFKDAEFVKEASCTLPTHSAIAAAPPSWHNDEALADLRHGTILRPV
jgi:hypothetical protein